MAILDDVIKIVKSFKPIEIKNEIKNPTFSPVVRYKSPSIDSLNFNKVEIDNKQLALIAKKVSSGVVEGIKDQVIGKIASDENLQKKLSHLEPLQLNSYLKTTVSGTATVAQLQPDFLETGGTVFPEIKDAFEMGVKAGTKKKGIINNVRVFKDKKKRLVIQYDES